MFKYSNDIYAFDKTMICSSGAPVRRVHELTVNEKGKNVLTFKEIDSDQIVESYRAQCSIERIILSHGLGDELVLDAKPGVFLDKDSVDNAINSYDTSSMNNKLLDVYKSADTTLSFVDFCKAVVAGDFDTIAKSKNVKETVTNE